jgi:hypothetical protein
MAEGLAGIITQLERQKTAIERALAALRAVEGGEAPATAPPVQMERAAAAPPVANKRSEAQRKRWAAKKAAAEAVPDTPAEISEKVAPRRKARFTAEGRARLAEAMKRRWAVKRAASAVKKTTRKKRAAAKAA